MSIELFYSGVELDLFFVVVLLLSVHHRFQIALVTGCYCLVLKMEAQMLEDFSQCSCSTLSFQLNLCA